MAVFRREARTGSLIRVQRAPEPQDFDATVRQPGRQAQAAGESESALWRRCLPQLHQSYRGICAYACSYIELVTGGRSVDHFAPKSKATDLIYEWSNYRLVCSVMNSRKHHFEDVLDPFEIEDGWFQLEMSFFQVFPKPDLDPDLKDRIQATIDRLKLDNEDCRRLRATYYDEFIQKHIDFDYLRRRSPFVAAEMIRQGLAP